MLGAKSVIRQMSEWAAGRAKEIGSENVFDFSLGNPSVAVPQDFTDKMIDLLQNRDTMALHGYSQSQGIPVRSCVFIKIIPYRRLFMFGQLIVSLWRKKCNFN